MSDVLPAPRVRPTDDGVLVSWDAVAGAGYYLVRIEAPGGQALVESALAMGTSFPFSIHVSSRTAGLNQVRVRSAAGSVFSEWSAPATFDWSATGGLAALRTRLLAGREAAEPTAAAYRYALDAAAFPAGLPARADTVAAALADAFRRAIAIKSATGPQLSADGDTLTLRGTLVPPPAGTAAFLGAAPLACVFTATVGLDAALHGQLAVSLPAGWTWGAAADLLAGDVPDGVVFQSAALTMSTSPAAAAGLQFEGTTAVRTRLGVPVATHPTAGTGAARSTVTLRGAVRLDTDGRPAFALTSTSPLDLVIARVGQDPLTLTASTVTLRTGSPEGAPAQGAPNASVFVARGSLSGLGGAPVQAEVDLPHAWAAALTVRVGAEAALPAFATVRDALALTGTPGPVVAALRTLPALPGPATISGLTVTVDASGVGPTRTELSITAGGTPWRIVSAPALDVTGTVLALAVTCRPRPAEAPGASITTFSAAATGTVTLGGNPFPVRVGFGAEVPATVVFTDPGRLPALPAAAASAGLTDREALAALPATLVTHGPITIERVVLDVDLTAQTVTGVLPRFRQSHPWRLGGAWVAHLELSDWTVDLSVQRGGGRWSPYGAITGTIALGADARTSTRFGVEARIPADVETGWWSFALAHDEKIHIPSVGTLAAPLGGRAAALPAGLETLGDLDIVALAFGYDPKANHLASVAFGIRQSSTWTIIPGQLAVSDLDASFTLLRSGGTGRGQATGMLFGTVTVSGHSVDASMIKSGFDGGWGLRIAWSNPVVFPGSGGLDGPGRLDPWLGPAALRDYLPATLPLARGFELSNVIARFRDTDGHLTGFGAQIVIPDLWTVIPDRLSITDVRAELDADYPVKASGIRGTIVGLVTVGGATIRVRAAKPTGTAPWEFSGSLTQAVEVDLVATANSLSSAVFTLPVSGEAAGVAPSRITVETAEVLVVPDTGRFHFAGKAGFDWHPRLGAATVAIEELSATVDIARTAGPVEVTLAGALSFAGLRATVGLRLGTAGTPAILTGTVAPADAEHIRLPDLADGVAGALPGRRWADVLPTALPAPAFSSAALWADLTKGELVLHGRLAGLGDAVLLTQSPSFALAVTLADGFTFSRLLPTLRIDDVLKVRGARLIVTNLPSDGTLGRFADRVGAALAAAAPGAPSPIADLAGSPVELAAGALFTADLDVRNAAPGTLLHSIMAIAASDDGQPGSPPSIRIFARIDQADPAQTLFTAELADLTLFGGLVTITHRAALPAIRLAYRPAAAHEFTLDARILLTLFGGSYGFDVALVGDDDHLLTVAETARPTSQSVAPFGLPGVQIDELALVARLDYAKPAVPAGAGTATVRARPRSARFSLTGRARLGPTPAAGQPDARLSLAAELVALDAAPVLVRLTVERAFSIASFLADCVPGGGGSWGSFVDVTLLPGSRIYYYRAAADPAHALARLDDQDLRDGYHLDARVTIRLVAEVTAHALITVATDSATGSPVGVSATVALPDPIDLRFAQLAGTRHARPHGPYTGGPELRFTTGSQGSFTAATGVNFLGEPFGSVQVAVSRDVHGARRFAGRLESGRELAVFGRLSCAFAYVVRADGGDSFEIVDWPAFTWARDLVDLVAAIREAFDAVRLDGCGALVGFAAARAFRTSWSLKPDVRSDGDDLVFSLTGAYALTLTGQRAPFLTVDLPPFAARVPSATRLDDLPDALATAIARGARDLVLRLLRDPEKIAVFAGVVFGPQAAAYLASLLCKDLVDAASVAAAEAAATALATALAGGATFAAGTAAATLAAIASLAASGGEGGQTGGGQGEGGQGQGGQGPDTPTPTPSTPTGVTLRYAHGRLSLAWSAARFAGGYEAELHSGDADGPVLASATLGFTDRPLQLTFAVPAENLPGHVVGRIRAVRPGTRSGWAAVTLSKLVSPAARVAYRDGLLVVSWDGAPGAAHEVAVTDPSGVVLAAVAAVHEPAGSGAGVAFFPLDHPRDGLYTARVRTLDGGIPASWGAAGTFTVRALPTPADLVVDTADGALRVAFTAVPGATAYLVELSVAEGAAFVPLTSVVAPAGAPPRFVVPAPAGRPYRVGVTYAARARAQRPDGVSAWSPRMTAAYGPGAGSDQGA